MAQGEGVLQKSQKNILGNDLMLNLKNTHYRMLVSQAPPSIYKEKIFTVRALVFERSLDTSTQKIGMRC